MPLCAVASRGPGVYLGPSRFSPRGREMSACFTVGEVSPSAGALRAELDRELRLSAAYLHSLSGRAVAPR